MLIRARVAFEACQFDSNPAKDRRPHEPGQATAPNGAHRQLFSEILVAEDVDLGSRIHALGYKSVFLNEVLARGEVRAGTGIRAFL